MSSMQAVLYDSATCDTEPVAIVEESIQALELTGNSNLLLIPSQFLPQCASLYVNNESTEYQISLATGNVARSETPYLQLSAYLSEECGETADLQISLIADESIHPIGKFAPQTIREMRQTFNPDFVQTQQFNEDQTPIMLYYKATIAGTITVYSSPNGNQEAEVMQVPLQQFMDTCFNQNSPFPGFSTQSMKGRSDAKNMEALQSLVSALGSRTVHSDVNQRAVHPDLVKQRAIHSDIVKQRGVQPQLNKQRETGDESVEQRGLHPDVNRQRVVQPQLNKQREAGDETIEQRGVQPDVNRQRIVQPQLNKQRDVADDVVNQDADHIANLFAGFNDHVRSRSQQGLPISFQITASTGPMVIDPSMQDQEWSTIGRPKPGHGKHGFKHHGLNKYMTPCQQEAGAMILGLLAVLLIIKMMMSRNQARRSTGVPPQMQERPVEKKNKDYVAVPTTSV